ncbi:hypothetical protein [Peribacillus simplex]|nr:hypothetical protein [Peribacillus simplex]
MEIIRRIYFPNPFYLQTEPCCFYLKALFVKIVVFKRDYLRLIGVEVRDSCGSSGTGEDPTGVYAEEAHRPPRGKRASGGEINHTDLLGK